MEATVDRGVSILVTGACGRIGSHVVRRLRAMDLEVCGIDTRIYRDNLRELADEVPLEPIDVQDLASLSRLALKRGFSHIIHLAAAIGGNYDERPWMSYSVNLGGSLNVMEAARLVGAHRVVMASTHNIYPGAYGPYSHPIWKPIAEDHPPEPLRPYAVMKLACEYMGRIFAQKYGVEFAAVRFASYYGAERAIRRGGSVSDVLNWMIGDAVRGRPTRLPRGGDQVFDPVYIKDCAHGVVMAALAERRMDGRVYNIGGGSGVTLFEAAKAVTDVVPSADIEVGAGLGFAPARTEATHHPWLDIDKARREIAYEPQYDLREGISDCVTELRALLA